jgi:hypothetical protein
LYLDGRTGFKWILDMPQFNFVPGLIQDSIPHSVGTDLKAWADAAAWPGQTCPQLFLPKRLLSCQVLGRWFTHKIQ